MDKNELELLKENLLTKANGNSIVSIFSSVDEKEEMNKDILRAICARINSEGGQVVVCKKYSNYQFQGYDANETNNAIKQIKNAIIASIKPNITDCIDIFSLELNGYFYIVVDVKIGNKMPYALVEDKSIPSYGFYEINKELIRPIDYDSVSSMINNRSLSASIENFIMRRCEDVNGNCAHMPLISSAKLVVHYISSNAFGAYSDTATDPSPFEEHEWGEETLTTIDGTLYYFSDNSYIQAYKNGIVEAVDTLKLRPLKSGKKIISIIDYQNDLSDLFRCASKYYGTFKGDVYYSISIVGATGYEMKLKIPHKTQVISKEIVRLPIIPISFEGELNKEKVLSQINQHIEMLWNASGF